MFRLLLPVLLLCAACDRPAAIAEESVPPSQPKAVAQNPTQLGAKPKAKAQPAPVLPWKTAKALTAPERRQLRAFYTRLSPQKFRDHFRVAPPSEQNAEAQRAALRKRTFLLELPVKLGARRDGIYLDDAAGQRAAFRWVWPLDVGQQIFLVRHKPRVNAGTGSPQLRQKHTWLFDAPTDEKLLEEIRAKPDALKFRALWKPRGARTHRYPVLVVRVIAWELRFGDRVLHTETDDR